MKKLIYKPFLIFLVVTGLLAMILLFKPFLIEIIVATALVSVFYSWYERLAKILWNKKYLASFIMCLLLVSVVIIPFSNFLVFAGKRASVAYNSVNEVIGQADLVQSNFLDKINLDEASEDLVKNLILDGIGNIKNWLVSGTSVLVKGATSSIISLGLVILIMFFFFVEGKNMAKKLILWSPLPNKYDIEIIRKFRNVSKSTFISIFVTAAVQGLLGAVGFLLVGWPFIFVFVIMAFLSLIPYIGSSIFYVPAAIYLILTGQLWLGIFILVWCIIVVSNIDEIIRAHIIKGKSEVNPIFIVFSIIGGISLFGFWGVIVGPLIISLVITIFHIYELEYDEVLEK